MGAASSPSLARDPERNVTTFTLRSKKSSESTGLILNTPGTPHLTIHQFRQFQQSPALSSPDLDFKRVRRKKSCAHLSRASFESAPSLPPTTSSVPSSHTNSSQNFLHSLLPPLPSTPVPRPGTKAPSLSSTVDTLQSTPTHTPVHHGGPIVGLWRDFERVGLGEPIRTKRKFPLFKRAKRLPHYTAPGGGDGAVWEVHAVVVDISGVAASRGREALEKGDLIDSAKEVEASKSSRKKGRSVRFKGINDENDNKYSRVRHSSHSEAEKDASLSSSFSLSKFAFPEPPIRTLSGTFGKSSPSTDRHALLNNVSAGQYGEPTPPTSPATLHYKGASFDVVNPHESLILGSSEIETPAEIDGLLDDYFHSTYDLGTMIPYDDITGEMNTSQQSLPTANSSNGRQRRVYDDADSARRAIMGLEDGSHPPPSSSSHPPAASNSQYQDSPLANRPIRNTNRIWLPGSLIWPQSHPGMWSLGGQDDRPQGSQPPAASNSPYVDAPVTNRRPRPRPRPHPNSVWLPGSLIWPQSHPGMWSLDGQDDRPQRSQSPPASNSSNQDSSVTMSPQSNPEGVWLPGSSIWPESHPGMWDIPRPLNIQRNLREALHRSAATNPNETNVGFEDVELGDAPEAQSTHDIGNTGIAEAEPQGLGGGEAPCCTFICLD